MQTLILLEKLGIGGIERSSIRLGESLSKQYSYKITLAYVDKLKKNSKSKLINIQPIEKINFKN